MEEQSREVMKIIERRRRQSGGHCGLYPVEIMNRTGIAWGELQTVLSALTQEEKIFTRPGSKGGMIFRNLKTKP